MDATQIVKPKAIIQGGAFRLDKGPTFAEKRAFELAVSLVEGCRKQGKQTDLCVMVNDLAVPKNERPKTRHAPVIEVLPQEYLRLLQSAHISAEQILIFYESTLRNRVSHDLRRNGDEFRGNLEIRDDGIPTVKCPNIMGRFYTELAERGYEQQIGFYTREPKPEPENPEEIPDRACSFGPQLGAMPDRSGYALGIEIINFWVGPEGNTIIAGGYKPRGFDPQVEEKT